MAVPRHVHSGNTHGQPGERGSPPSDHITRVMNAEEDAAQPNRHHEESGEKVDDHFPCVPRMPDDKERPDQHSVSDHGTHRMQAGSFSFPSGHAMGSMIGYGMLIWTLFVIWHPRHTWKVVIYLLAGLLVVAIGLSRIFLGVHYPSDVVGGWAAALAWLAVCITGVNVARHRHAAIATPEAMATLAAASADRKGQP